MKASDTVTDAHMTLPGAPVVRPHQNLLGAAIEQLCRGHTDAVVPTALQVMARSAGAHTSAFYIFEAGPPRFLLSHVHPPDAVVARSITVGREGSLVDQALTNPDDLAVGPGARSDEWRAAHIVAMAVATDRRADVEGLLWLEGRAGHLVDAAALRRDVEDFSRAWSLMQVRHRDEQELARLRTVNSNLDSFNHRVSHDLMQPVRTITEFSRYLLEDTGPGWSAEARALAERVNRGGGRLQEMLRGLLLLSRSGTLSEETEHIDMNAAVSEAVESLRVAVDERHAAIVARDLPPVQGNRTAVAEILTNLVSNAVKFNPSSTPRVDIGGRPGRPLHAFYVSDNGVGIPPQHHKRIFELFVRLPQPSGHGVSGTGAGLAIVKRAVEAHGGSVWVESAAEVGSTFWFTLPAPPSLASPSPNGV